MLNFTIKLISDAGFQGEITSISTAAQQIEVFSRILKNSIITFLQSDEDNLNRNMSECAKMVCHGQHTYVYAQVLLSVLAYENKGKTLLFMYCNYGDVCAKIFRASTFLDCTTFDLYRRAYNQTIARRNTKTSKLIRA